MVPALPGTPPGPWPAENVVRSVGLASCEGLHRRSLCGRLAPSLRRWRAGLETRGPRWRLIPAERLARLQARGALGRDGVVSVRAGRQGAGTARGGSAWAAPSTRSWRESVRARRSVCWGTTMRRHGRSRTHSRHPLMAPLDVPLLPEVRRKPGTRWSNDLHLARQADVDTRADRRDHWRGVSGWVAAPWELRGIRVFSRVRGRGACPASPLCQRRARHEGRKKDGRFRIGK